MTNHGVRTHKFTRHEIQRIPTISPNGKINVTTQANYYYRQTNLNTIQTQQSKHPLLSVAYNKVTASCARAITGWNEPIPLKPLTNQSQEG
eukprot:4900420-Amphidinium_carterae.1